MSRLLSLPAGPVVSLAVSSFLLGAPLDDLNVQGDSQTTGNGSTLNSSTFSLDLPGIAPDDSADQPSRPSVDAVKAFQRRDIEACLKHLRKAVAEKPNLPPPKLLLAGLYQKSGMTNRAKRLLENVAATDPNHPELYLTLANIAIAEGRYTEAMLSFDQMERLGPPDTWSDERKRLMNSTIALGKVTIAEKRGNWEQAQSLLAEVVRNAPENTRLRDRWATALLRSGREQSAFDQFDIAYQQDNTQNRPEVSMGVVLMMEGKFGEAEKWYEKAVQAHPNDPEVHLERAKALMFEDRAIEAQQHAAKATQLGMVAVELDVQRGVIARQLGKFDEAKDHLRRALADSPDHEQAAYHLVLTLAAEKDDTSRKQALKFAEAFLQDGRPSAPKLAALGAAQHANKQFEKAEKSLRLAVSRPDADAEHFYLLARVLAARSQEAESQRIGEFLRDVLDRPMLFVLRPAARRWIESLDP